MPAFGTSTAALSFGATGSAGSASTLARSDHTHTVPAAPGLPLVGSITFEKPTEEIYVAIPPGVASMYVTHKYTSVATTIRLQIKAVGGSASNVSENSSSQTSMTSFAGTAVIFSVTGMDSTAMVAAFGFKIS
jgi:hypothetical protein